MIDIKRKNGAFNEIKFRKLDPIKQTIIRNRIKNIPDSISDELAARIWCWGITEYPICELSNCDKPKALFNRDTDNGFMKGCCKEHSKKIRAIKSATKQRENNKNKQFTLTTKAKETLLGHIENKGYDLVTKMSEIDCSISNYVYTMRCPECNNTFKKQYSHILVAKTNLCKPCGDIYGNKKLTLDMSHYQDIEPKNLILPTSGISNSHENILIRCECGNVFSRQSFTYKTNTKCVDCVSRLPSKLEQSFAEFLDTTGFKYKTNIRAWSGNKYELDFYIPELGIAFELNGNYWHSSAHKDKNYHINKLDYTESKNIKLINIFESEWYQRNEVYKKTLLYKMGISKAYRYHARECVVSEIDSKTHTKFLEVNHLQGMAVASIKLGLYSPYNVLISVMSFSKSRYDKSAVWELIRYSTSAIVPGGASKLLKHFRRTYTGSIVSYANRMWSSGDLYRALGFDLVSTTSPGYKY